MAIDAALLTRQKLVVAKLETTTGTAIALAASDGAHNVFDATLDEDIPENQRQGQGTSLDPLPSVPGARAARLNFKLYAYGLGSGVPPAWAQLFLPPCGYLETTGSFAPVSGSASAATLTASLYEDGLARTITGAAGNVTVSASAGNPWLFDFSFLGAIVIDADLAMLAPTFPTVIPPRWAGTTNTIGGTAYKFSRFSYTPGNVLKLREHAGNASGYHACAIVDRLPEMTFDPEASLVATQGWQAGLLASTQYAVSVVAGGTANNIISITAPKAQPVQKKRGDRGGLMTDDLTLRLCRSASAGEDSSLIVFT